MANCKPRRPLTPAIGEHLVDPAHGERVPRCAICGMPDRPGVPLLPGYWAYAARKGIDLVICERDYLARLPRYDPNQLSLEDAA